MKVFSDLRLDHIMTDSIISINSKTILTEVASLFEKHPFHHLPVLDERGVCIGVVSKSDLYQLQSSYTRLGLSNFKNKNQKFFSSLIAEDVMSRRIISLYDKQDIRDAINVFIEHDIRAIIINNSEGKCVGIVSYLDILKNIEIKSYA